MTTINVTDADLAKFHGKTVIITGGSTGIGEATVKKVYELGANVVVGDINVDVGEKLGATFPERVTFQKCDVSSWEDQRALFQTAYRLHGSLDVVFANAGVTGKETLLNDEFEEDGALKKPEFPDLNINLVGAIYSTKLAIHYFKKDPAKGGALVITGSAASYLDTPPLWCYCAGKAGVLGLMRSLRSQMPKWNCSVNLVAPWFTKTPMAVHLGPRWGNRPANSPEGVARALLYAASDKSINGKGFWVGGDQIIEMEDEITNARPQYLTPTMAEAVSEGQRALES
ncbi:hypothetical protein RUND412_006548 [Rhizina undulata]